jgi:hypothetical protein
MLQQIEVGIAKRKTTPQACKEATITVLTFYRWRQESGIRWFEDGPGEAAVRTGKRKRQAEAAGGAAGVEDSNSRRLGHQMSHPDQQASYHQNQTELVGNLSF